MQETNSTLSMVLFYWPRRLQTFLDKSLFCPCSNPIDLARRPNDIMVARFSLSDRRVGFALAIRSAHCQLIADSACEVGSQQVRWECASSQLRFRPYLMSWLPANTCRALPATHADASHAELTPY